MQLVFLFLSFWLSYLFFLHFSHPQKKKHKLPHIKIKNIELSPNIRIHTKDKIYHVHHWFYLLILTIISFITPEGILGLLVVKSALVGGIVQGLRYPDRFQFRYPPAQ